MAVANPEGEPESEKWEWLSQALVETLHAESLSRFGGTPGMRDKGLLESALARPRHLARYEEPSAFQLAAAYCEGIISTHPFLLGCGLMTPIESH